MYATAVSHQGWKELDDTDQYRIWTTFVQVKKPQSGIVVSLKTAQKGVDGSITNISIVSVNAVCGANRTSPNYVQMGMSESFDEHGPIAGDAGGPTVRLVPDTNLAVAVQRACSSATLLDAPGTAISQLPSQGKCSIQNPDYPAMAARQHRQGIATISFDVVADGHTSHTAVLSSSGSPDLDQAALSSVSNATCNLPAGTRYARAITFSLQN
jgi:TonB family protein